MVLPLNTITVGAAVTPEVTKTWFQHYLNRKPLKHKPTAHISYDLGLHLVRRFVNYSALHTVEELQNFTGQWVPIPRWVKGEDFEIPQVDIDKAAQFLQDELGPIGIEQIGGKQWWQWRRDNQPLKAEWIEMRKDWQERKENNDPGHRVMLYVHGGAYYFGSVDEHRYQIQRHARKLKARCLAPRYRLAPQFPFPCGLHDCLSAYLYLLGKHDPTEIIVAGDSAGGAMVLSMLIILRNQGLPLPAGGVLISPWVDLMHSFPSLSGDGELDYIPSDGFIHKPSVAWPPPTLEDNKNELMPHGVVATKPVGETISALTSTDNCQTALKVQDKSNEKGYSISDAETSLQSKAEGKPSAHASTQHMNTKVRSNMTGRLESSTHIPSIMIDGKLIQIRDQIQLYAANNLLTHPLVSPVLQPTLGGLPPLLIQIGGGEMLRDEQLYIAHKAANPSAYPTKKEVLDRYDPEGTQAMKYPPTDVQVQLWDDMCHVGHTLSWTRPAKFMYRSVAQFGAWALAHAQQKPIDIPMDDDTDADSVSSDEGDQNIKMSEKKHGATATGDGMPAINLPSNGRVGKAGDPLPQFKNHMIRQRIDRHGTIWDLAPAEDIPALQLNPEEIGVLKEGPVKKWLARQERWNKKFASTKRNLQKKKAKQTNRGYEGLPEGEMPPPTALAGMRPKDMPKLKKIKKGYGMMMWSGWGSKHDEVRLAQERNGDQETDEVVKDDDQERDNKLLGAGHDQPRPRSRSRSRSQSVMDEGQAGRTNYSSKTEDNVPLQSSTTSDSRLSPSTTPPRARNLANATAVYASATNDVPEGATVVGSTLIPPAQTTTVRPTAGGVAYPFKLKMKDEDDVRSMNASLMTLNSEDGGTQPLSIASPMETPRASTPLGLATPTDEKLGVNGVTVNEKRSQRPQAERFETAAEFL